MWRVVPSVVMSVALAGACADEEPSFEQAMNAATGDVSPATAPTPLSSALPSNVPSVCAESSARSAAALSDAIAQADAACTRDEDCALVWPSTSCHASCWVVLSQRGALQLEQSADQLSAACASFEAFACSRELPSCEPAPAAACIAGTCRTIDEAATPADD